MQCAAVNECTKHTDRQTDTHAHAWKGKREEGKVYHQQSLD